MQKDLGVTATFKDHFSEQSGGYARYRPCYPDALYQFLASISQGRETAWDCGTGNGQAAVSLADFFDSVIATDASKAQIDAATRHPGVSYRTAAAENSGLSNSSIDLITVGQAYHWFDEVAFLNEARRVLRGEGVLAIWFYETCTVDTACDEPIEKLYRNIVGQFWPPERVTIENGYSDVSLPGPAVAAPDFEMAQQWSAEDMLGYLRTWSACKRYRAKHNTDPVCQVAADLQSAWGPNKRRVAWPLKLKASRPNTLLE